MKKNEALKETSPIPNAYPKLHNAMWPGLVDREPGTDHPPISLERMLELTAAANVNGQKFEGIDYFDDSKGTNVAAAVAALRGLAADCAGRIVLIAGGVAKENEFTALAAELARVGRAVVLIGEAAVRMQDALGDVLPVRRAAGMDAAVSVARSLAQTGDIVLLSPACASFDMFRDFEERGDAFARAVQALAGGGAG